MSAPAPHPPSRSSDAPGALPCSEHAVPHNETSAPGSRESWAPLWRSSGLSLHAPTAVSRTDEFPHGATLWPADLDRREFLKLLGGSLALAGLASCGQHPEKIVPYVVPPEDVIPGVPSYYATAMPLEGYARGVLVKSHLGRPTKIEGNPDHPDSLGAADAMTQAAIWSLYDPDRSRVPRRAGQIRPWEAFQSEWLSLQRTLTDTHGRGLALLLEPTTSPTELRLIEQALEALPAARWYQHTALARYDLDGVQVDHDFAAADVVFSIGSDFLYRHPAALRYSRAFATRRRITDGKVHLNRLYAIAAAPDVTTALADFRLPLSPARTRVVLNALARALAVGREESTPPASASSAPTPTPSPLTSDEKNFVTALARDLRAHAGSALCIAGPEEDADIQRWALAMNAHLGATPRLLHFRSAVRSDAHRRSAGTLPDLAGAIERGEVHALLVLGANPVHTAPADLDLAALLGRVPFTVHLGAYVDETARRCLWHVPESHFLETWSDLRAFDGTASVLQPLIRPRFATQSCGEMLALLTAPTGREAYDLVRETWRARIGDGDFETAWSQALNRGVVDGTASATLSPPVIDLPTLAEASSGAALTLVLRPDPKLLDGRFANIPWLQELPHAITQLVWDNAAFVSPGFAREHDLATGDAVELFATSGVSGSSVARLEAAVFILPGHAPDCLSLALGYGRSHAGSLGRGHGFDAYRLRRTDALWHVSNLRMRKLGRRHAFVTTQGHFTMEDRDLVRRVTPDELHVAHSPRPSLYDAWPRGRYGWGMSIDLSTCLGCQACVVACQAENNIPSVGKGQVARGREMLWLRVDRYFSGDAANPQMLPQPVPCMHCENAPCEVVCPVAATVHSSEGLNDMVYNRCIGTRYCSNNCPYKVRRFNFLDYRAPAKSSVHLQDNPDVTVRERGVMEKCTYCVQRINAGRIAAERENRRVRDGEVRTACQQACPVEAIIFGDLNDPDSAVSRRKRERTDYSLLEEQNTRPRTTYLAKILAAKNSPAVPSV